MGDLLRTRGLSAGEFRSLLDRSSEFKRTRGAGSDRQLEGKSVGLVFEKASTRTRVSLEVAVSELGGDALYLSSDDLQLGRSESIEHTAEVLSRYLHGVAIRTHSHGDLVEFSSKGSVPVVNALSDEAHPCQSLADFLTLREAFGSIEDLRLAWVGDGNNVCNSFVEAAALAGAEARIATPPGYVPDPASTEFAEERTEVALTSDPAEAVAGADAVYTDVWVSMGDEDEVERRMEDFRGFSVTEALLDGTGARVLHCMPIQGPEIEDSLVDSERSLIFEQAENRLHTSKAIFEKYVS